jgi:hypothetical protein
LSVPTDTVVKDNVRAPSQSREEVNPMLGLTPEGDDSAYGRPWFAWAEGSAEVGPVPAEVPGAVGPDGLDYEALLEALADSGRLAGADADQDAVLADELAAAGDGRMSPPDLAQTAALAVEHMAPGAAQAAWLEVATAAAGRLDEDALAGVAIAAQQAASHAHATGLTAAAQISARAADADSRIGLAADGRPVRLCRDAQGQIGLALMLPDYTAAVWADLGITLAWRLPATGAALTAGRIDLDRAKAIAGATGVLSEQRARQVEATILPQAGRLTVPDLKDRLARAVIAADPDGAERRRQAAERHADVRLYGEVDQTATLVADKQPQIEAAAGFARLNALARARKAAGFAGPLGWHRSQVLLGLLNGTLPPTPPAQGAPPDQPPPDDPRPNDGGPNDGGPNDGGPNDGGPNDGGPGDGPGSGRGDLSGPGSADGRGGSNGAGGGPGAGSRRGPDTDGLPGDGPAPRDEDAPEDDGLDEALANAEQDDRWDPDEEDDLAGTGPESVWPELGAIPPALARPTIRPVDGRPVPGLLDVTLPWTTLADHSDAPGLLGRIGPITAEQARHLARTAETDQAVPWRVIVTNAAGQAIAVSRIRRRRGPPRESSCRDGPGSGLVGRITVTISRDIITASRPPGGPDPPSGIAAATLRAAAQALERALAQARVDAQAGGCAHAGESSAYRPPPRLREFVIARDVTCRKPTCRQPAWRGDLDHTHPYDQHGRTCGCNLGGACRGDHQLKQHPRWKLEQTRPGEFTWTTPAGRTYTTEPDVHPV